jgi:hypothetical protein
MSVPAQRRESKQETRRPAKGKSGSARTGKRRLVQEEVPMDGETPPDLNWA